MTEKIDLGTALRTQAASLRTAQAALSEALDRADLAPWRTGETVAVVAMGASTHSAEALMAVLRRAGVRGVNLTASDLAETPEGFQPADHYVFVSESGRSPEPVRVAERCTPGRRMAITNDPDSPLAQVVDVVLTFGGIADSRVYTSGYSATLLAYDLLVRNRLGEAYGVPSFDPAAVVDTVLEQHADRTADLARHLADARDVDFVGRDVSRAAAEEGALVFREAARVPAAAFETYQYLHGPMESLADDSAVVVFGDGRELDMVAMILEQRIPVVLVTQAAPTDVPVDDRLRVVRLPQELSGFERAIAEAVVMQQTAAKLAERRGLDVDEFRFNQPDTKIAVPAG